MMDGRLPAGADAVIRRTIGADSRVERVVLFGSRAKGTHRPGSDIDLAVVGRDITFSDVAGWKDALEELLFPWTVDVVAESSIENAELREHIARVGIPVG